MNDPEKLTPMEWLAYKARAGLMARGADNTIGMSRALDRPGKHVYAGTVPATVVKRRRAANKTARASRRANRGRQ